MSPKIGMGIDLRGWAPRSQRPIDKVRAAVAAIEAQGLKLCLQCNHGVGRHKVTGGWVADGRHVPRRVSLAGAVCLHLQPANGLDPADAAAAALSRDISVEDGAACALDVTWDWLLGLLDGWDGDAQTVLLEGANREHYLDGLRAGHLVFAELTVECGACGQRRYRGDADCVCAGRSQ